MVQADRGLDHRLQEVFFLTPQFTPNVFQSFMGIKEAASVKEFDAVLEFGDVHYVILTLPRRLPAS